MNGKNQSGFFSNLQRAERQPKSQGDRQRGAGHQAGNHRPTTGATYSVLRWRRPRRLRLITS